MTAIGSIFEYQLRGARRYWRSVLVADLASPLFYVLALGVGLGTVVNRNGGSAELGVPYLVYVAPALLAAAAVTVGASEASYPVHGNFKWIRTYHGMAATPLSSAQIADGVIAWIGMRTLVTSSLFLCISAVFGGVQRWLALLSVPAAALCGIAVAAPVAAYSASRMDEGQGFNVLRRFIIVPMFLFAGTFYPISRLPDWAQWLAYATPLWHGTELARAASIGGVSAPAILGHVAYLAVLLVIGVVLARRYFRIRIET
ncbi:MAG: ABC transporter permease [Jatrophihabitantaceae bacterium]